MRSERNCVVVLYFFRDFLGEKMPLSKEHEDYLSALYFDIEKPGAYRSPLQLWRQVKKDN